MGLEDQIRDIIEKYNPYHDKSGRFASSGGGGSLSGPQTYQQGNFKIHARSLPKDIEDEAYQKMPKRIQAHYRKNPRGGYKRRDIPDDVHPGADPSPSRPGGPGRKVPRMAPAHNSRGRFTQGKTENITHDSKGRFIRKQLREVLKKHGVL